MMKAGDIFWSVVVWSALMITFGAWLNEGVFSEETYCATFAKAYNVEARISGAFSSVCHFKQGDYWVLVEEHEAYKALVGVK